MNGCRDAGDQRGGVCPSGDETGADTGARSELTGAECLPRFKQQLLRDQVSVIGRR